MKGLGTKDRKVERVDFILSEPEATVDSNQLTTRLVVTKRRRWSGKPLI